MVIQSRSLAPELTSALPTEPTIRYQFAETPTERIEAFRLVYENYLKKGLISANEYRLRATPFHLLPTTNTFVAKKQGHVFCTITLNGDGELGLPMERIYPEQVAESRAEGYSIGEVTCLAMQGISLKNFLPIFIQLLRLMTQHARQYGMDRLMIATHPRHARFYKKFMGYEQVGEEREYPSVKNALAVACCLDFDKIDKHKPVLWNQIFENPIPPDQLRPHPMTPYEIDMFCDVAAISEHCLPVGV